MQVQFQKPCGHEYSLGYAVLIVICICNMVECLLLGYMGLGGQQTESHPT
jgi:hypothetical protein